MEVEEENIDDDDNEVVSEDDDGEMVNGNDNETQEEADDNELAEDDDEGEENENYQGYQLAFNGSTITSKHQV